MQSGFFKYLGLSNLYKHVYKYERNNLVKWRARVLKQGKYFDLERDAALHVDKILIKHSRQPINILKIK